MGGAAAAKAVAQRVVLLPDVPVLPDEEPPEVPLRVDVPVSRPIGVVAPGPLDPIVLLFAPPMPPGFGLVALSVGVAMLDVRPLPLFPVPEAELPMLLDPLLPVPDEEPMPPMPEHAVNSAVVAARPSRAGRRKEDVCIIE